MAPRQGAGNNQRGNAQGKNRPSAIAVETKLHVDEAAGHLKNGNYSKALYSYNQVHNTCVTEEIKILKGMPQSFFTGFDYFSLYGQTNYQNALKFVQYIDGVPKNSGKSSIS